jgi:hypothetical protein
MKWESPKLFLILFTLLNAASCVFGQFTLVNVAHVDDGGTARDVVLSGNFAFLANDNDGLRVYEISDPTHPIHICHTNISGHNVRSLALSGQIAYAADGLGLAVYDVSDPTNVVVVAHTNSMGFSSAVAVSGNFVYLGFSTGLRIYDVSSPAHPVNTGQLNLGANSVPTSVALSGNYAYLAGNGLYVLDVSNPALPFGVGYTQTSYLMDVAVSGNFLYAASDIQVALGGGLRIFDISNPTNPVARYNKNGRNSDGLAVSGHLAFLSEFGGPSVYDISNPTNPIVLAQTNNAGFIAAGLAVSGNYIYLARASDGLRIYRLVPQLSLELTATNTVLLSWPVAPVNDFTLQQNSDLATMNWLNVTNSTFVISNRNQLVLPSSTEAAFFRLKSP